MVDYNNIFLQKTGLADAATPDESLAETYLDNSAYIVSRTYATPWADFDSVPDEYQYAVTIFAAIEYWWSRAGIYATNFDTQIGGNNNQKSSQRFDRVMEMLKRLNEELESLGLVDEGSGDILVGDLVIRSKFTGYLVPRSDDPEGDWTS